MTTLVFLLEEPSARDMLEGVVPRLLPEDVAVRYVAFEGKQDMHNQLERRLRGWLTPATRFIVVRDQDSGDCQQTKQQLVSICQRAGRADALVRIACRELESFYLGDLDAVERGLGIGGLARRQSLAKFRQPDRLNNAKQELKTLTDGGYQERSGSRAIGGLLDLSGTNRSHSFNVLVDGIRRVADELLSSG